MEECVCFLCNGGAVCVLTVQKLQLCDELDRSSCGNVLFNGYLPPPGTPESTALHARHNIVLTCRVCRPSVPSEAA